MPGTNYDLDVASGISNALFAENKELISQEMDKVLYLLNLVMGKCQCRA